MKNILLRKAILITMIAALLLGGTAGHRLHAAEPQPAFRMANIFTDHMVLQRDQPLPVWGWAAPGRIVTVEVGPHSARTRANAEGRWRLTLPSLESGKGSLTMTVKAGDETVRLTDILVGEVWLCSGQSNMEMTVSNSANGKAEVKAANHPNIRLFNIPRPTTLASDPQDDVVGQWQACSPETIGDFSAVGYYFGREINQSIDVPVGLISASWGGTIIETWTRHEEISRLPGMTERIAEAQDIHRDPTVVPQDMSAKEKRDAEIHLAACTEKADYKIAFEASMERRKNSYQAFGKARANDELARKMTSPDLDLSSWKTMEIPNRWGEAGLPDFRGMVWFRKTIDVPASWASKNLVLHLDRIYEGDVTWFNGQRVGATPPNNYYNPRVYSIPARLVKAGANTITVRVIDTFRPRGMSGRAEAMELRVPGSEETDRISLAGPWRYKPGPQLHAHLPHPKDHVNYPTLLYNTMIHPLVPFAIRGITWYQGEQNHGDGMLYFAKMQALIQSWRNVFLRPDAPFYFVQIAPYRYGGDMVEYTLPELWEAQTAAMDIPHTGMAVISDVGHVQDIHPSNKQDVGKRLALWAFAKDYGQEDLVHSGPLYKSMAIEGSKIRLSFDHTGSGLASRDDKPLDWFLIAGENGRFVKAQAVIDGNTIVVSSDAIAKPTAARFAWHQEAVPNLMNKEGLPAAPFRTNRPTKSEQMKDPRPIVRIHDTSVNPFLLSENGIEFGDPFPSYWDGVWHLYSLSSNLKAILHFTSTDLVKWTEHQPAMTGVGIATGTVVRDDNHYYLFYTDSEIQQIRVVVSDNPWLFDFSKSQLVAKADEKVYQMSKGKFRDCYVFYYEKEKLWWMLVEATSDNAIAVGLFKSKDLLTWTQHDPISKEKSHVHGSCPQVFEKDGRWYLTYLDYDTRYATADTPYGPWDFRGKYHSPIYTAASRLATDGKRQLGWGFFAKYGMPQFEGGWRGYGGRLGVGRELVFNDDGDIGVRPLPELITAIRQSPNKVDLFACVKVRSGKWEIDSAGGTLHSEDENSGVLLFDLPEKKADYYFETDIQFESPLAKVAVVVRTSENCDRGYRVVIEPNSNKIAIRECKPEGGTFNEKSFAFAKGKSVRLQVFISGNQIDAFVDGRASLSTLILDRSEHRVAIEVENGRATISKPLLHYFAPEE